MNIDWALCECLKTTNLDEITDVMVIYDVMCQYHRHLMDRIQISTKLSIPDTIRIVKAIGLFHVHGHQDSCLYRFATTYIPGVGHVDGEVLETLWSILNGISRSTRTATLAHRSEILDDHMGDSNWKKNINMASTISGRFKRAVVEQKESKEYFDGLTVNGLPELITKWTQEIELAESQRQIMPESMDIMQNRVVKGKSTNRV